MGKGELSTSNRATRLRSKFIRPDLKTLVLFLNGIFWVGFWVCFLVASQPNEDRFCLPDHCLDPYIFWGRAIGLAYNPLAAPFMKVMVCLELPAFFLATVTQNLLTGEPASRLLVGALGWFGDKLFPGAYPNTSGGILFLGISINGYRLLATMLLSFFQWYFIGWVFQKLWHRWASHSSASPNHAPSV
jgi:hypothetical protein